MALGSVISSALAFGYYDMTWDPVGSGTGASDLGLVEGPRFLDLQPEAIPITADAFGDSVIEYITRGGNVFLSIVFKEWGAIQRKALWPFATLSSTNAVDDIGEMGQAGRAGTGLAGAVVLTPRAGNPAASIGGTYTFYKLLPVPGQRLRIPLGNVARDVPVVFQSIGVSNGTSPDTIRHFTVS